MRTVELTKVAVAAEGLRLRRYARRQAFRVAYAVGAAVFGIAALAVLHFTLYLVLNLWLGPIPSVLVVLALDVVAAAVLATLALSNKPDSVEQGARDVRAQALIELRRSMTTLGMAAEVGGALLRRRTRSGGRAGAAFGAVRMVSRLFGR